MARQGKSKMGMSRSDEAAAMPIDRPLGDDGADPRDTGIELGAGSVVPGAAAAASIAEATPSMAQFLEIKAANPDSLLWYRMGDFYELFFDDAVAASKALSIVLTKRGKHLGLDIPMCGVPIHRADEYLQRLIRLGYRVAVCEQLEDPAEAKKRGSKSVVKRDVVRLVTPGTLTEDTLLDARNRNYLTAIFVVPEARHRADVPSGANGPRALAAEASIALASVDISTGEFEIGECAGADLPGELVRLGPSEVLASDATLADADLMRWIGLAGASVTPVPVASFDSLAGERSLKAKLAVAELGGFGGMSRAELAAAAALLRYIDLTQLGRQPVLRPPRRTGAGRILTIDAASRASLELVRSTSGARQGSLLDAIDRTVTGPGARELAARLSSPLRDPREIEARLDAVGYLMEREPLRSDLRAALKSAPDIARAVARLAFGRGSPRDLAAVRDGLSAAAEAARLVAVAAGIIALPAEIAAVAGQLTSVPPSLHADLQAALIDEPPHLKRDGGFVRVGYRADLDELHRLRDDSRQVMANLEATYAELTGVKSLKVRHNNVFGFFVEVTQLNAKPLLTEPLSLTFRHRQTMSNAVRFTTMELVEIEGRIASAGERALAVEQEVFAALSAQVMQAEAALGAVAQALAAIDVMTALAELAVTEAYVRPEIDDGNGFEIRGGRHPVVEQALRAAKSGPFIENDCVLGSTGRGGQPGFDEVPEARIWLVTGPNMAGKSTFLRQSALIAVLAQMGSYVPAALVRMGVLDRVFSRVGASDDLARGRSTFMVEMVETSAILNQATDRSLVILDEIGRGTATFDGLSIAWATVEHLASVSRCRALFATHYHELTALADRLADVASVTIDVKEWHDDIIFLHKLKPGAADRSYGIQVAKLAGLPASVVSRAAEVLAMLENGDRRGDAGGRALDDLPLFAAARPKGGLVKAGTATSGSPRGIADERAAIASPPPPSAIDLAVAKINPDELTPRQALEALYDLRKLIKTKG